MNTAEIFKTKIFFLMITQKLMGIDWFHGTYGTHTIEIPAKPKF